MAADSADSADSIGAWWQDAIAAHPTIAVSVEQFVAFVAQRPHAARAHAIDLLVACGCAAGDAAALAIFDRTHLAQLRSMLGSAADQSDEIAQQLRVLLFAGERPRIVDYQGKGALGGWVRVAALRLASNARRAAGVRLPAAGAGEPLVDPDLLLLDQRYRELFERALKAALAALGGRERNLVRLHLGRGVSLDRLAVMNQVHRATIARWLKDAREALIKDVYARLQAELPASSSELRSLAQALRSRLDLNLSSILGGESQADHT